MKKNNNLANSFEYDGSFYEEIGDFIKDKYLDYGFTKGTKQEVDFLVGYMELPKGSRILDIGCGPGRHSLALARQGYETVGVDISSEFINLASLVATEEKLSAQFITTDARELMFHQEFDAAICLCEGAFGLAGNEKNHRKVLRGVHRSLKPGSQFILTVINALHLARRITDESEFDPYSCTSIDREKISNAEGVEKDVTIYTTAFTFRELKFLLDSEGFEVVTAFGCTAGAFRESPLKVDSMEIMVVSERR
ncbi:class I SAM-dependent methyltransferase [Evansella sp. AB-rgal1]|uniref:class I SAM-dependent methyltransferase n=1 Tax=Evansella sp. AB-rgal1 TaxID=3242696 RepID=UPI00359D7FA1